MARRYPACSIRFSGGAAGRGVRHSSSDAVMRPFLRAFPGPSSNSEGANAAAVSLANRQLQCIVATRWHGTNGTWGWHSTARIGRPSLLQQSLEAAGVGIAGLQECRTAVGSMRCGRYTRFASGADTRSCFGVELWIHEDSPCPAASVAVLPLLPYISFCVCHLYGPAGSLDCCTCASSCAHLCGKASMVEAFLSLMPFVRRQRTCHSHDRCKLPPWERNLSSRPGPTSRDAEDESGYWFRRVLEDMSLWLPATFAHCMVGDGGTLRQKRSGSYDRSDFIGNS